MIDDQRQIDFFKKVASYQYAVMLIQDYAIDNNFLVTLTNTIGNIYRYLHYNSFNTVTIYSALEPQYHLSQQTGSNSTTYVSYENLTAIRGQDIVIHVKPNLELEVSVNYTLDVQELRKNCLVYKFERVSETECFYGKTDMKRLDPIPDADSYFSIQTYKTLELALEDYKTKIAMHSECVYLQQAWFDNSMIFFGNRPEHKLRDSLTQFLKMRLRNVEVRPEQIVDKSHPVDIKVTWALANRLALLEIKWIGKSVKHKQKQFTQRYYERRALEGAGQLANYLDENIKQSPTYATKGYLIVYDARRANCNLPTIDIVSSADGLKFINEEFIYNPDYNTTRTDFAKPYRFFMKPKLTN